MPASHVQVAPDSTGKEVDAVSIVSTEAGTPTVYRQVVVLGDPSTYGNQAAITVSGALKVDASATTQPVSGTVAVTNLDVALSTRLKAADTLAGVTTVGAVTAITNPVAVTGTFFQATQPVSGSVSVDLTATGTNANPLMVEATILTSPLDVQQNGGNPWGVTQSTTPWAVSGAFYQAVQPVSITGEGLESLRSQRIAFGRSVLRPRADKLRRVGLHA